MDSIISSSPPLSPRPHDVWVDVHGRHFVWTLNSDGYGQWVQVPVQRDVATPSPMTTPITNPTPKCTSAPTPPLGPQANDLWFDTTTGFFFIFYNDGNTYQWVVTNPGRGSDVVPPSSVAPVLLTSDPGIVLTPDPFIGLGSVGVDTAWFDARVLRLRYRRTCHRRGAAGGDLAGSYPNPVVKASVALGGNPTATTQAINDSSQRLANTQWVKNNIAALPAPPTTLPPSGTAGGDLSGSYPNPTIKPGTNTQLLTTIGGVAAWAAPPSTAPSGAAGGALSGTYPNPGLAVPYPTTLPPNGAAGGALTGTYPNPALVGGPLSNYALTSSIPTTLPPSGAAGGALTGTYPNPTLVGGPLSNYALTSSIPTTLPPSGAAGGDLAGTYPNPTIKPSVTNGQVLTTVAGAAAWAAASGGASVTVGTTPPGSPVDGQLWYNSDGSNGGGALYVRYNDSNSTQWVPASPAASGTTVPPGAIMDFAGAAAPSGWLLCQGQSLSTTTYAALFAAIGYLYGGSGANFNVPDLGGRVTAGKETTATRLTTAGAGIDGATLGAAGGTQTHG